MCNRSAVDWIQVVELVETQHFPSGGDLLVEVELVIDVSKVEDLLSSSLSSEEATSDRHKMSKSERSPSPLSSTQ